MIFSGNRSFRAFFLPCLEKNVEMKAFMTYTLARSYIRTHSRIRAKERKRKRTRESANFYHRSSIDLEDEWIRSN